jgi:uncharacterized LabA/DUF88 family protein
MAEPSENRVAVYIDFDNIVISRFSQKHPSRSRENLSRITAETIASRPELGTQLRAATVDISAILDFASSFGSIVVSRAYADWSAYVNAAYRKQLIARAVDLVQLFPTSATKNGADIRLAVDVIEDLFRLPDLTHVVIVAGDSDYIALAQRSKKLGRYVVGIGVAGSTSASLAAACDEFEDYDNMPGLDDDIEEEPAPPPVAKATRSTTTKKQQSLELAFVAVDDAAPVEAEETTLTPKAATRLLVRALQLLHTKEDADWVDNRMVKNQMLRMDPTFSEKAFGHGSFTDFIKSRNSVVELDDATSVRKLRLRTQPEPARTGR